MMDEPMLIEFLGVPGVGKTTLARGLAADLAQHGYNAAFLPMDAPIHLNRYIKLAHQVGEISRYAAARPRQALRTARVLRYFPQPNLTTFAKVIRYWLRTHAVIERERRRGEIIVCDQGYYQGLYSLARLSAASDQEALSAALRLIPRPKLAILVTADSENVLARLRSRRYAHRSVDKLLLDDRRCLDKSVRLVAEIAAALGAADRPLIVYEALASVTADTRDLATVVREQLQRATAKKRRASGV
jgi:thymidylate kinase